MERTKDFYDYDTCMKKHYTGNGLVWGTTHISIYGTRIPRNGIWTAGSPIEWGGASTHWESCVWLRRFGFCGFFSLTKTKDTHLLCIYKYMYILEQTNIRFIQLSVLFLGRIA